MGKATAGMLGRLGQWLVHALSAGMVTLRALVLVKGQHRAAGFALVLAALLAGPGVFSGEPTKEQEDALGRMRSRLVDVKVDYDERLGSPSWVRNGSGLLSGEGGIGGAVPKQAIAGIAAEDPHLAVKAFVNEYHGLFGFGAQALAAARAERDYVNAHNGMRTTVWQQEFNGLPVYGARLLANITARGELLSVGSHFVPDAAAAANAGVPGFADAQANPPVAASEAMVAALKRFVQDPGEITVGAAVGVEQAQHLTGKALLGEAQAQMAWFPTSAAEMHLAWDLVFTEKTSQEMYRTLVDVQTGAVLGQTCLTGWFISKHRAQQLAALFASAAPDSTSSPQTLADPAPVYWAQDTANVAATCALRVFTGDSPSPFTPGWPTPNTAQPPLAARTLVTLSALNSTASPDGWVDITYNDTRGNNVDAHTDVTGTNTPDLPRPAGTGSPLTYDFPLDLTQAPSTYRPAAVVNLFYWCNFMHDKLFELGFTEAAGNFQNNNYGRGGVGNDAVQADGQDGSGTNNANFSTPPDGSPGRMQMFLWTTPSPQRDGDFDAQVIQHEYTHGLSNRMVGGGVGISALQPRGMGEGWSDFYSLSLLADPGDDIQGTYPVGAYVIYGMVSDNYYRGIRRYPYVIEPGPTVSGSSKNPLTFGDTKVNAEVHDMGEVWCETLWEARAKIVAKYGFNPGNQLMMQLVTDAMKLGPANPTFLQARDAILQADTVDNAGADLSELWQAFAKRGMGYSAQAGAASTTSGVVEAFDVPGDLRLTPTTGLSSSGSPGGPFAPGSQTYTLQNGNSTNSLSWTASNTQSWVSLSPTSGTLAPGATVAVAVSINSNANSLAGGTYSDTVTFTNVTTGSGTQSVGVSLLVARNYTMVADTFSWIDPSSHTNLALGEDSVSAAQTLPFIFSFYGQPYTQLYVGANGLIGFALTGMTEWVNTDIPNAAAPNNQIYPWWDDLSTPAGGTVRAGTVGAAPNRQYVVSWVGVPWYGTTAAFTFQAVLCETSNLIIFQYLNVQAATAYGAGKSATIGVENSTGQVARKYSYNGSTLLSNNQAIRFIWDNTPPSVTVNQAAGQPDPASLSPINFTVVFSEPVTDFTANKVVLSGSAGATTAVISGGGPTYNVAVGGMASSGDVIVSIAANTVHDLSGNGNVASTSTDNTVTHVLSNLIWNGGSTTTDNWSDDANWSGAHLIPGSNLLFAGTNRLTPINDTAASTVYGSIRFDAGGFNLTGNALALHALTGVNNTTGSNTVNLPVNLDIPLSLTAAAGTTLIFGANGVIANNGNLLTVDSPGTCCFNSVISGAGGLTKSGGAGSTVLLAASSYTGPTTVNSGTLYLARVYHIRDGRKPNTSGDKGL